MLTSDAFQAVLTELQRAQSRFPPFHSAHEGIAVVEEEFLELRGEVFSAKWDSETEWPPIVMEAIQLAAMAMRFLIDVCPEAGNGT